MGPIEVSCLSSAARCVARRSSVTFHGAGEPLGHVGEIDLPQATAHRGLQAHLRRVKDRTTAGLQGGGAVGLQTAAKTLQPVGEALDARGRGQAEVAGEGLDLFAQRPRHPGRCAWRPGWGWRTGGPRRVRRW
jgi:hypothetical protein